MLGFKKLNRKNNNEKSDNRYCSCLLPILFLTNAISISLPNQINFEGYSKTERATAFIPKFYFTGDRTVI
jgi:hypothetical protein